MNYQKNNNNNTKNPSKNPHTQKTSFEHYNKSIFKMFLRKERKTGQEDQQDFTDVIINKWNDA